MGRTERLFAKEFDIWHPFRMLAIPLGRYPVVSSLRS